MQVYSTQIRSVPQLERSLLPACLCIYDYVFKTSNIQDSFFKNQADWIVLVTCHFAWPNFVIIHELFVNSLWLHDTHFCTLDRGAPHALFFKNLFLLFPCEVSVISSTQITEKLKARINNHLFRCHFLSQGPQVRCRVSQGSSVGTWAAAVLWLSFRMSWMWNDSFSDVDCYTSLISYPRKQMLVSHRGITFPQKQHEDIWREVRVRRIIPPSKEKCKPAWNWKQNPTNTLCLQFSIPSALQHTITLYVAF